MIKKKRQYDSLCVLLSYLDEVGDNIILVNEKMQVIDGQHRLISAIKNKTFIYYIIAKGYDLEEVKALNMQQKNWSTDDFLYSYANMGIPDLNIEKVVVMNFQLLD